MSLAALLTVSMAASTPSEAVVDLYREACVSGELQLTPQRGELVDVTRMPDIIFPYDIEGKLEQVRYIRMKQPSRTYILIEHFDAGSRPKFETVCRVASRQLTEMDAQRAFFNGVKDPKVTHDMNPGRPFEPWVIDQPQAGLRKRLFVKGDWTVIETSIYAQAK